MQQFRLTYFLFAQTESPEKEKGNEKIEIDWNILILKKNNAPQTSYIKRMTIKKALLWSNTQSIGQIRNQTVKKGTKEKKQKTRSVTLNWYPCLLTRSRLWKYWAQCRGFGGVTSRSTSSNTRMFGDGGICLGMARSRYRIEKKADKYTI